MDARTIRLGRVCFDAFCTLCRFNITFEENEVWDLSKFRLFHLFTSLPNEEDQFNVVLKTLQNRRFLSRNLRFRILDGVELVQLNSDLELIHLEPIPFGYTIGKKGKSLTVQTSLELLDCAYAHEDMLE